MRALRAFNERLSLIASRMLVKRRVRQAIEKSDAPAGASLLDRQFGPNPFHSPSIARDDAAGWLRGFRQAMGAQTLKAARLLPEIALRVERAESLFFVARAAKLVAQSSLRQNPNLDFGEFGARIVVSFSCRWAELAGVSHGALPEKAMSQEKRILRWLEDAAPTPIPSIDFSPPESIGGVALELFSDAMATLWARLMPSAKEDVKERLKETPAPFLRLFESSLQSKEIQQGGPQILHSHSVICSELGPWLAVIGAVRAEAEAIEQASSPAQAAPTRARARL